MDEINKTYRLYMWIDNDVVIGNVDEDYTIEEWNDVFASVKVNVSGDLFIKYTDASCFKTTISNNEVTIIDYDETCDSNVLIPNQISGYNVTIIKDSAFYSKNLTSVVIPSTVNTIDRYAFGDNNIKSVEIPNSVTYFDCSAFDNNVVISKK